MGRLIGELLKGARWSGDLSAPGRSSEWPTDPRDCASDPLSSASASAAVAETADAGSIASPERYLHWPPIVPAAVSPPSPSGIFLNHLRAQNNR